MNNDEFKPIFDKQKNLWINKYGKYCSSEEVAKRDFKQTPCYGYYYNSNQEKVDIFYKKN